MRPESAPSAPIPDASFPKEGPSGTAVLGAPTSPSARPQVDSPGSADLQVGPSARALQAVRQATGRYPPRVLHDPIRAALGDHPSVDRLRECYQVWCARGYNPQNYAWLLEWYAAGVIPSSRTPRPKHGAPAPGATPDEFSRWREYQELLQKGESPDEAKRRLGL